MTGFAEPGEGAKALPATSSPGFVRELGLATAFSEVRRFDDELAIVVTRYDRARTADLAAASEAAAASAEAAALDELAESEPFLRLHQEDTCQALAIDPGSNQNEGGPTPGRITELLRGNSSSPMEDVGAFVDALGYNWVIAGTDAHAKIYSVLLGAQGQVRLAPLYDLASALPYPSLDLHRLRLAMKIGSTYRISDIQRRHWRALCQSLRIDEDETLGRLDNIATGTAERARDLGDRMIEDGLDAEAIARLVAGVTDRARACRRLLADATAR